MADSAYYSDDFVTLYHGDCRQVAAWLDADILICDPPYGRAWRQRDIPPKLERKNRAASNRNTAAATGISNDADTAVRDAILAAWGQRPAIVFGDLMLTPPTGTQLVATYRKPADAGLRGAVGGVRRDQEAIYFLGGWPAKMGGRSSAFATHTPNVGGEFGIVAKSGGHPHAKPLDVLAELISLGPGIVTDPTAGSGATLVAAKFIGRKAIGVELDERYCEMAARRLAQDTLFGDAS